MLDLKGYGFPGNYNLNAKTQTGLNEADLKVQSDKKASTLNSFKTSSEIDT